jgi:anti-sigma factor RsiW
MTRYDELLSLYLDGEPSEQELDELVELLKADDALAKDFREQLIVWEHYSQSVAPERSFRAFEEAMKVRLRAEIDARSFQKATRKRIRTTRILRFAVPIAAVAAVLSLMIGVFWSKDSAPVNLNQASVIPVMQSVEVQGESVCTVCTLHHEGSHSKAIRFTDGAGETQVLLLENDPELRSHTGKFCGGPNHVHVHGETHEAEGAPLLAVSELKYLED